MRIVETLKVSKKRYIVRSVHFERLFLGITGNSDSKALRAPI